MVFIFFFISTYIVVLTPGVFQLFLCSFNFVLPLLMVFVFLFSFILSLTTTWCDFISNRDVVVRYPNFRQKANIAVYLLNVLNSSGHGFPAQARVILYYTTELTSCTCYSIVLKQLIKSWGPEVIWQFISNWWATFTVMLKSITKINNTRL